MNLSKIRLNVYSFGFSAGFAPRGPVAGEAGHFDLESARGWVRQFGLKGIEFPFDHYFSPAVPEANARGLRLLADGRASETDFLDFEKLNRAHLETLLPRLREIGIRDARIKMLHLGPVFYGGNRYSSRHFAESFDRFKSDLRDILPLLRQFDFRLWIENHQDLSSVDLTRVIEMTDPRYVGVNWDVGNSLSVGDSVESFFSRLGGAIGNVHLKDYRLAKTERGFKLIRCALGEGVVDFERVFALLASRSCPASYSIELGAHLARECDVNRDDYWNGLGDSAPLPRSEFMSVIEALPHVPPEPTPYEAGVPGERIIDQERSEMKRSIEYLYGLEVR